ncbi:MAG: TetR/AcrR family transcriptional regulator [Chloroflexota bacterium]
MAVGAPTRQSAEARRESVVAAAIKEFAQHGYAGTSTMAIARRVGVSQPYLFQLFGTKKDIFVAAVGDCFARVRSQFESVAEEARKSSDDPLIILHAMGMAYCDLLVDRDLLRLQMHAYAACDDADIQAVVRAEWTHLYGAVVEAPGADDDSIHKWFAEGMLMNVAAIVGGLNPEIDAKLRRP